MFVDRELLEQPLYVTLSARPPRVAVFIPLPGNMPWPRMCELVLAAQSRLWGGSGNLILPGTDDIADNELFWALAERFDADYFASATFTLGDLREVNRDWYAEWEQNQQRAMDKDIPDASAEDRANLLERMLGDAVAEWGPQDEFVDLVERRLAPFHRERSVRHQLRLPVDERGARTAGYPLSDVTQLRGWPEQVVNPETELGPLAQLMLTARTGRLSAGFAASLADSGKVNVAPYDALDWRRWSHLVFQELHPEVAYPWTLTELGLAWYRQGRWEREDVVLVTGETPWDFTLYHALRRWAAVAFWLPQDLGAPTGFTSELVLALSRAAQQSEERVLKVVTSSDEEFRDQTVAELNASRPRVPATAADWRDVLPQRPHRLLERDSPGHAEPIAVHGGTTVELPTPIPAAVETRGSGHFRWVTEARAHGWAALRHGALATEVLDQPGFTTDHARTGRSGVVYTSIGSLTFGGDSLTMSTVRPLLRLQPLLAQLDAALRADGWSCQGSDKGAYATESALLFGGFRKLAEALLDPVVRPVLEAFRATTGPGKKAADRRYLTFADIVDVLRPDAGTAEAVVDNLTNASILTRGLFLKCGKCRRASWYDLSEVTTVFRCRRCRSEQRLSRERWLGTVEPEWHYELAEVVRSLLDHNGDLPILAVHRFFPPPDRPEDEIEVAFEIEVLSPEGTKSESDIAVREGTKLWLGEATTKDYLERAAARESERLKRLSKVADLLAAQGVILASTTRFRERTRSRAAGIFHGYWPALHIEEEIATKP